MQSVYGQDIITIIFTFQIGEKDLPVEFTPVEATIFATSGDLDIYAAAAHVRAPVLLVRAGRGALPTQAFSYLASVLPDCTLLEPDVGHLMPLEAPDLTLRLLTEFARSA